MLKNALRALLIALFLAGPLAQAKPLIVFTDMLPDDVDAMVVLSAIAQNPRFQADGGAELLFVTCDDQVELKARALHNQLQLLGLANARVVAGNPSADAHDFPYVDDYRDDEGKEFLKALAETKGLRPWRGGSHVTEIQQFVARNPGTGILLLAGPASLMDAVNAGIDHTRISWVLGMGFWKAVAGSADSFISAYNGNSNISAAAAFLDWVKANGVSFKMVPSQLVTNIVQVAQAISRPRAGLFSSPAQQAVMGRVIQGLGRFRDSLANVLFRKYGPLAGFVQLWDPAEKAWLQDPIVTILLLNFDAAEWQKVDASFQLESRQPLGVAVTQVPDDSSTIEVATSLDLTEVSRLLKQAYEEASVLPDFNPAALVDASDRTPIGLITKASIDDLAAARALLGLGDRLKLVITESTHTPLLARVYERLTAAYGRGDIAVRAGVGHVMEALGAFAPMKLEKGLIEQDFMTRALISEEERAALMAADPSALSAEADLTAFLEANAQVDLVVTTSVVTLNRVLTARPELSHKIRTAHLMGGWRTNDSVATRNWFLDIDAVQNTLGILQSHGVNTYVYSTHQAGGSLNPDTIPATVAELRRLEGERAVDGQIGEMRRDWNRGMNEILKIGIDPETGYGPALAYLMAARVALGAQAERYYPSTKGRITFAEGKKLSFIADERSTIHLVDNLDFYPYMDQTVAHLSRVAAASKAVAPAQSPGGVLGRIRGFFGSCAGALGGRRQ